jgi:hypothetical protein
MHSKTLEQAQQNMYLRHSFIRVFRHDMFGLKEI